MSKDTIHVFNNLNVKGVIANGEIGTAGQVLHSNGTATYWAIDENAGGTITSVATANGLSGGPITTTGTIGVVTGSTLTVNAAGIHVNSALSITDLALTGNLTVSGTRTYVNTTTLEVGDNIVTLNADLGANPPTENAGIEIMRGTSANAQFIWDESNDRWSTNGQPIAISSLIAAGAASGITTLAAGNTTITGFANVSSSIQGGSSLTIAGAASGITTLAAGNTTITGFANISSALQVSSTFVANSTAVYATKIIDKDNGSFELNSDGTSYLNNLEITDYFSVSGNADFSSDVTVYSMLTVSSTNQANLGVLRVRSTSNFEGNVTFSSGGSSVSLSNGTSNRITWGTAGVAAPTFTSYSAGTKLVLYDNVGASSTGYAIGIDNATMWFSTDTNGGSFKWYGGTTNYMSANATVLSHTGSINAPIFKDSDNTAYYTDPYGTSVLNAAIVNGTRTSFELGSLGVGTTVRLLSIEGNYTTGQYAHRFRKEDVGGGVPLSLDYSMGTAGSYTQLVQWGPYTGDGGYLIRHQSSTRIAGNLMVKRDANSTNVGDSASIVLSNRNTSINGGIMGGIFADTFRDVVDPHYSAGMWFTRVQQVSNLSSSSEIVFGTVNTAESNTIPTERMRINTAGNIIAAVDMRAPIFYNTPDTAYYVNPDSTSNLLGLTVTNTITGNITGSAGSVSKTVAAGGFGALVESTMGDNDFFRIAVGGASNAGYVEIATADDGNEPIYVRQYTGVFSSLTRTATLLDGSGNTSFPGSLSAGNIGTTATANHIVQRDSNADDYRRYGFAQYFNMSHAASGATTDTVFYSSGDDYIRKNTAAGFRASLNVPTRTGGDASGTWGINVTGSAGSLSDTSSYFINRGNIAAASIDTAVGLGVWNQLNAGDSHTIIAGGAGGSTSTVQMRFHYTGSMEFRNRTDSSTWTAFKTVLTNANYNSYAPTLTGTGASGTWAISVTGNAATVTNGLYTSGDQTIGGVKTFSSRAQITQQDTINTTTPGTTKYGLHFNGQTTADQATGITWNGGAGDTGNAHAGIYVQGSGSYGSKMYLATTDSYVTGAKTFFNSDHTGQSNFIRAYTTSVGSFRAPLFYDSNDTAYYVDPAGGSRLGGIITFDGGSNVNAAGDFFAQRSGGSTGVYYFVDGGSKYLYWDGSQYVFGPAGSVSASTIIASSASVRAPIFYDSNDTGYYIDPNATADNALRMRGGALFGPNTTWSAYLMVGGNGRGGYVDSATTASVSVTNGNLHIDSASGFNTYINWYDGTDLLVGAGDSTTTRFRVYGSSDYTISSGSSRAPLFYDSDNTGFFVDPNSTSSQYRIAIANGIALTGQLALVGSGATLDNATGARLTENYGPVWNLSNSATWHHQVINGSMLCGFLASGANWGSGRVVASSDMRATLFYDYDDTGYYTDPNSTSYINILGAAGRIYTGYDSGQTNAVSCSNWFRSNGNTGWFNASYGGGVVMEDGTYVRIYNGKALYVPNAIDATGNITAYYSDERLKTRTGQIQNAIDKVKTLDGFYYVENETAKELGYNNTEQQVGLSAQQVQAILPEAIHMAPVDIAVDENGNKYSKSGENYLTVDYSRLVPLLIEAIKEQQAHINKLETKINSFEQRLI